MALSATLGNMNSTILSMLQRGARSNLVWQQPLAAALSELAECTQICLACADACLGEDQPAPLRRCIRLTLLCAAVCHATTQVLHRQADLSGALVHDQLRACVSACRECAEECRRHAEKHEHCRICATSCQQCQGQCNQLLGALTPAGSSAP